MANPAIATSAPTLAALLNAPYTSSSESDVRDRAAGALLGLAVGNVIGLPSEFRSHRDVRRAYPNGVIAPDPAEAHRPMDDDLAQAVDLGEALASGGNFVDDFARRIVIWMMEKRARMRNYDRGRRLVIGQRRRRSRSRPSNISEQTDSPERRGDALRARRHRPPQRRRAHDSGLDGDGDGYALRAAVPVVLRHSQRRHRAAHTRTDSRPVRHPSRRAVGRLPGRSRAIQKRRHPVRDVGRDSRRRAPARRYRMDAARSSAHRTHPSSHPSPACGLPKLR